MSQFYIVPFWICESRSRFDRDQRDLQFTELHITNPGDTDARFELVVYESRGDGSFYRADWGDGRWAAPARWQRVLRLDPSRSYGAEFYTYGWAELWLSSDRMVADVVVGGVVKPHDASQAELMSRRSVPLTLQRAPFYNAFIEGLLRNPVSPLHFPGAMPLIPVDRHPFDPPK